MTTPEGEVRAVPSWVPLAGAVLVGVLTATQSRINGELGLRLGDGLVAAAISFASGLVIVVLVGLCLRSGRHGLVRLAAGMKKRTIPWWMLCGGLAGALTVASQGLVAGIIGVSLFTVGIVAGQTVGGLIFDRIGYGPAGAVAITVPRLAGGLLALVAVVISLAFGPSGTSASWWMIILPLLAGVGISWQQATNGRLRQRVDSAITATTVNFAGGTLILVLLAAVSVLARAEFPSLPPQSWLYLGGAVGVAYIAMSSAIVARTGVLLMGLAVVVGQLTAALVMDSVWPPLERAGLWVELATVGVALASVAVAAPWRRRRRA